MIDRLKSFVNVVFGVMVAIAGDATIVAAFVDARDLGVVLTLLTYQF